MRWSDVWSELPGADLIREGFEDLAAGAETIPALLVSIGAPRLRRALGDFAVAPLVSPEHRLYDLLARDDPRAAHSRYNACIRRLFSLERALESFAASR